ncbi:hypothetical protein [Aquipuribacter nitratireducens]|uniref:Uncharacterized protein n=1 Tax=Aquipuribacter nitratireducens TaxID=650104 RepID=A0ABW0GQ86_9MICO
MGHAKRALGRWGHALTVAPTWVALRAVIAAGIFVVCLLLLVTVVGNLAQLAIYGQDEARVVSCAGDTCTVDRAGTEATVTVMSRPLPPPGQMSNVALGPDGEPRRLIALADYLAVPLLLFFLLVAIAMVREALHWESGAEEAGPLAQAPQ